MTSTGAALVVDWRPRTTRSTMLTWVWPPLALALAVWTYVHMRRDLTGPGRWLVTVALVLLAVASVGAGVRNRRHRLLRQHLSGAGHHPLRG